MKDWEGKDGEGEAKITNNGLIKIRSSNNPIKTTTLVRKANFYILLVVIKLK